MFQSLQRFLQKAKPFVFLLLPISFFLTELFGFFLLAHQPEAFAPAQLWPLAFGLLWAAIMGGIIWLLPRKAARIGYGIVYFLMVIYAGFQTGYFLMFGQQMWLSDLRYASEGADYASVLLSYPIGWWLGLLGLIALGGLLLWEFPHWQRSKGTLAAAGAVAVCAVICALLLPQLVFFYDYQALKEGSEADRLAAGDYGRMQSAEAAYENLFNAHRLYQVCGLHQMLCKDLYAHHIYPHTPAYMAEQKAAMSQIGKYLAQGEAAENEMTGIFAGKDVVLVLMESMDDWMIGEHTPTISRLMAEGINFTQFYTPGYGGIRTFNTEFCVNTGSYLSSQGGYAFDYVTNHFDQSLSSQLMDIGYSAKTFHYNDPAFYSRGEFSPAMGYEDYVYYRDYISEEDWEHQQYDDTILFENEDLCNEFFREGQLNFNFIITRSAHLSYKYNEVLSWWGLKKYPQYRGLTDTEEMDCAYLKARLVDDLFASLLAELEVRGRLENTVIIGVTDHYTYGYRNDDGTTDNEALMQLSDVEQNLLLERTPCFIWSTETEPLEVEKTLNTADLLPTLLNLLGVDSPYHYIGCDAFDPNYDGFAPFPDGSWICGNLGYDASEDLLFTLNGTQAMASATFLGEMHDRVEAFVENNNLILKCDYYKK
jgi:phosphoglycerol transferase MdoB-like AlkP superfamily enzyme